MSADPTQVSEQLIPDFPLQRVVLADYETEPSHVNSQVLSNPIVNSPPADTNSEGDPTHEPSKSKSTTTPKSCAYRPADRS